MSWLERRAALFGWSLVLGTSAMLAVLFLGPMLLVALALTPLRVGAPMTVAVTGWIRGLADLHRLWSVRVMHTPIPRPYRSHEAGTMTARFGAVTRDPATWRDARWLAGNAVAGPVLAGGPVGAALLGLLSLGYLLHKRSIPYDYGFHPATPWPLLIIGVLLLTSVVSLGEAAMRWYAGYLRWSLGPASETRLANRVDELTRTRTETLDTQAAEIRRIERDLHDGAQARLVSLGMSLGMAEKLMVADPAAALQLLSDAKQSTGHALSELRELVHGIHPPILADRGLGGAAQALALASPLPISVTVELAGRAPAPVESAVYFALTEIVANVTKHSAATTAWIRINHQAGRLILMVADNGMGGASAIPGGGLDGIGRRLAAFDGVVSVASPTGGPTIITMEVPCDLGSVSS